MILIHHPQVIQQSALGTCNPPWNFEGRGWVCPVSVELCLITGRHISTGPVLAPLIGTTQFIEHDHKTGQVFIYTAQTIIYPGSDGWMPRKANCPNSSLAWQSHGWGNLRSWSEERQYHPHIHPHEETDRTHIFHWPYCLNFHFGITTRLSLRCPPRPKVFT